MKSRKQKTMLLPKRVKQPSNKCQAEQSTILHLEYNPVLKINKKMEESVALHQKKRKDGNCGKGNVVVQVTGGLSREEGVIQEGAREKVLPFPLIFPHFLCAVFVQFAFGIALNSVVRFISFRLILNSFLFVVL